MQGHLLPKDPGPSPEEAAGGQPPHPTAKGSRRFPRSPSMTFMYTFCRAGQ